LLIFSIIVFQNRRIDMDTIVVGDLHGNYEIVDQVVSLPYKVVFIGDYLDSWTRSVEDQVLTLLKILNAVEHESERVTALYGNHEISYMHPHMRCAGWNMAVDTHLITLYSKMFNLLVPYTWVGDFLVTHAGISKNRIAKDSKEGVEQYLLENTDSDMNAVGRARGGVQECGGMFWCDWYQEFEPLDSVPQIVGHSAYRATKEPKLPGWPGEKEGILKKGNSYNIDCLEAEFKEVLLIKESGEAEIIDLADPAWTPVR
jgi:hypothetical protein